MAEADAWVKLHMEHRGARTPPPQSTQEVLAWPLQEGQRRRQLTLHSHASEKGLDSRQKGKSAGEDQISYDILHLFDERTTVTVTKFFNICFDLQWIPTQWTTAIIKMLFKLDKRKDAVKATKTDNYRTISLLACLGKMYERLLNSKIEQVTEVALPSIDDSQTGYRKQRDAKMHIFTIQEVAEMMGSDLLMVFIDMAKCFESVYRSFLLMYLYEAEVDGKLWSAVASFYDNTRSRVWVTNVLSEDFEIAKGIREGAILSPAL